MKRAKGSPHRCKSIRSGTPGDFCFLGRQPLTGRSLQDALRDFFRPIKTDDPRVEFYTVYKREATKYDTDYVNGYNEDLNTTLIFVRRSSFALVKYLTCSCRRVFSLLSAPPSSSMSIRSSNLILTSNPPPFSAPSFSLSISPPSLAKPPPSHLFRKIHRTRSSPSLVSCTRVF